MRPALSILLIWLALALLVLLAWLTVTGRLGSSRHGYAAAAAASHAA